MNKGNIRILLVDDHPMILEGYKNVLSKAQLEEGKLEVETSINCQKAWEQLREKEYHIIFVDINFSNSKEGEILSGEELGIKIKKEYPSIKIVVLTVLENRFRVEQILRKMKPDGFLLKGETGSKNLLRCLDMVLAFEKYYSPGVAKIIHSGFSSEIGLDQIDEEILRQLSLGTKTKNIPQYVHLSLRTVEDRKRKIKKTFGVEGESTRLLLEKAKEYGYL